MLVETSHKDDAARGPVALRPAQLFGARFLLIYIPLYSLPAPLHPAPFTQFIWHAWSTGWNALILWVGTHVFRFESLSFEDNGTGDRTVEFVRVAAVACIAAAGALLWMLLDRKATRRIELWAWLRVYVRFVLADAMLLYGVSKLFPIQFGTLGPHALTSSLGESSPVALLWAFMAASAPYGFFGGAVEALGGALLLWPRTTLLGALLLVPVLANVVLLNFCYHVGVKLYSLHLLLMALFLIAPDMRELLQRVLRARSDVRLTEKRSRLGARLVKYGVILSMGLALAHHVWSAYTNGRIGTHMRPLQGVWEVEAFARNGAQVPACQDETGRWQRLLIENQTLTAVTMDSKRQSYRFDYHSAGNLLTLRDRKSDAQVASLTAFASPTHLKLAGRIGADDVSVRLRLNQDFPLLRERFTWIDEVP